MFDGRRGGPTLGESVLRYWWVVVTSALILAAIGYFWSAQQDNQYTATTRLFLAHSSAFDGVGQSSFVANPDRYAINQATLATSRPVLARAVDDANLDIDTEELGRSLVVTAGRGNDVIIIEATASSPQLAARHANAVTEAYQSLKLDEVERQTEQLTALSTSEGERAAVLKRAAVYGDGIELVESAAPPENPSSPQPLRDALLALVVGAGIGAVLAAGLDLIRRSRRSEGGTASREDRPPRRATVSTQMDDRRASRRAEPTSDPAVRESSSSSEDQPHMAKSRAR